MISSLGARATRLAPGRSQERPENGLTGSDIPMARMSAVPYGPDVLRAAPPGSDVLPVDVAEPGCPCSSPTIREDSGHPAIRKNGSVRVMPQRELRCHGCGCTAGCRPWPDRNGPMSSVARSAAAQRCCAGRSRTPVGSVAQASTSSTVTRLSSLLAGDCGRRSDRSRPRGHDPPGLRRTRLSPRRHGERRVPSPLTPVTT